MMRKILALICVCSVLFTTGCSAFIEGFMEGVNEAHEKDTDNSEDSGNVSADEEGTLGQPHNDSEVKSYMEQQIQSGVLRQRLIRFTGYEYKTGISMQKFSERETVNQYLTDIIYGDDMPNNTYFLSMEKEWFQEGTFAVTKADINTAEFLSMWFYIGDVNSDNQPHGYGMVGYLLQDDYLYSGSPTAIITYIGEFKKGRKNGYGVQFYAPDSGYYVPQTVLALAKDTVWEKQGLSEYDKGYSEAVAKLYRSMIFTWANFPIYEGEFKDNKFSGKGNYCCPYVCDADEFGYFDVSENDMIIDCELIKRYLPDNDMFMMISLYVGTFKDGKPDRAKCYSFDELEYDGQWRDFAEPK